MFEFLKRLNVTPRDSSTKMLLEIFLSFAVILGSIYFWWMRQYQYWKKRGVPYIEPSFPAGTLRYKGKTLDSAILNQMYYNQMKGKGGLPFCGNYLFFKPSVLVTDVDFVKQILVKDFESFHDRGLYFNERDDPLTAHLLTLEGEKWKRLRAKITPTFTSARMKYMFSTMIAIGHTFVDSLALEHPKKVEIKEMLAKFTTDMIGNCAFGLECNSLKDPDAKFRTMGRLAIEKPRFTRLVQVLTIVAKPIATFFRIKVLRDDVAEFFMGAVRDTVTYREKNNVARNDFMDLLLKLKNDENQLTVEELAAQCFVFFMAGFETSSTAMSYALFELAQNQEIQQRARQSVEDTLKRHNGEWSYDSINDMHYVDYCIQESLKKYPPAPNLIRVVTKDYDIPGHSGVVLKKGMIVNVPIFAIHRDPVYYPEPEEYKPERFLPEEAAKRPSCSFLAFGEGPRNCIGMRFGLMQARIGLALLLKNFKFSLNQATKLPLEFRGHQILLATKGGMYLDIEKI